LSEKSYGKKTLAFANQSINNRGKLIKVEIKET